MKNIELSRRDACRGALALTAGASLPFMLPDSAGAATVWEDVISNSLSNRTVFDATWITGRYPWGDDSHNGSAKMRSQNTLLFPNSNPGLAFVSQRAQRDASLTGQSAAPFYRDLHYYSGVMYARQPIAITSQFPAYAVSGEFRAPSWNGTWPAFWLTARDSWPPETDILEFKGDGRNYFNTFNETATLYQPEVFSSPVPVSDAASVWHKYRIYIEKINNTDAYIHYYLDDVWQVRHLAKNWVGKALWIIMNLQMEGDSGGPGPGGDTWFEGRNIYVGRQRVS